MEVLMYPEEDYPTREPMVRQTSRSRSTDIRKYYWTGGRHTHYATPHSREVRNGTKVKVSCVHGNCVRWANCWAQWGNHEPSRYRKPKAA